MPGRPDFVRMLQVLSEHDVEFILVGGVCAVVHGAPVSTFDLDIVHARTPENVKRLSEALAALNARYRYHTTVMRPAESHLETPGHQLLTTDVGDLDVLGAIDDGKSFGELLHWTETIEIAGHEIRLLDLPHLIEIKRRAGRPKDLAVIPLLESAAAVREEE